MMDLNHAESQLLVHRNTPDFRRGYPKEKAKQDLQSK